MKAGEKETKHLQNNKKWVIVEEGNIDFSFSRYLVKV